MVQYVRLQKPVPTKDYQEFNVKNNICHIDCFHAGRSEVVSHVVHDTSSRLCSHVALVKLRLFKQKELQYGELRSKAK